MHASVQPHLNTSVGEQDQGRIFAQAQAEAPSRLVLYALGKTHTRLLSAKQLEHGTMPGTPYARESAGFSPCAMENPYAATGSTSSVALRSLTTKGIFALDVEDHLTELKCVLEQRKLKALMPYNPEAWERELNAAGLLNRYPHIPEGLH
jgi:hypothetical protein